MKNKMTQKALKLIVQEYAAMHGESVGDLKTWSFSDELFDTNEELSNIALKASPEPIQKKKYVQKIIKHLEAKGYIRPHGGRFFLSERGLDMGSRSGYEVVLEFLNNNPGLISLSAVIISILALYVSYTKP